MSQLDEGKVKKGTDAAEAEHERVGSKLRSRER